VPLPLNVPQLLDRCLGSRQLVARVLTSFEQRFWADAESIREALAATSHVQAAQAAHRLRGAAANVAAEELCHLAAQIEEAVREQRMDDATRLWDQLRPAWLGFTAACEEYRRTAANDDEPVGENSR
jgi:HPt (histidine-containing phosphotransfer) domain-containing protein